ncbi:MAG: 6,7-dimethyl-8-ribityllumazine synthase [Elusimicrobia bacterium RIFCSPLOWO2_01_FULL_54_10]|nr:MAG: 6,7-dimethyl-8-ribityllumazine synthase [Elusimicrobia bacterium RIFCSPLOWO2_01_FULL_54_10]
MRIGVVVSRFNQNITQGLLDGAMTILIKRGVILQSNDVVWVPGAFELPAAVLAMAQSKKYNAVIALGCVLKGETLHNQYIAEAAAQGLMQVIIKTGVPVAFGVLTPNTLAQAKARSGKGTANKGVEAAEAALEMASLLKILEG